jgi:3-oxoacyl-[acyl-carrier-protein] synthase-3
MNGADVFNFVLLEIPKDIKNLLATSQETIETIDHFVFHQANSYMNDYLKNKMKLPEEKVPTSIEKFGNTSSVSIPLTITLKLKNKLLGNKKLLLSGFGVGMSWASAVIQTCDCKISEIVEI